MDVNELTRLLNEARAELAKRTYWTDRGWDALLAERNALRAAVEAHNETCDQCETVGAVVKARLWKIPLPPSAAPSREVAIEQRDAALREIVRLNEAAAPAASEPRSNYTDALNLVNEQAEDDGLWFNAQYATEAYLQQALRELHAAIEGNQPIAVPVAAPAASEPNRSHATTAAKDLSAEAGAGVSGCADCDFLMQSLVEQELVLNEALSLLDEANCDGGVDVGYDERLAALAARTKTLADWRSRELRLVEQQSTALPEGA